jgi:seryl-tRNA synthetase
MDNQKRKVHNLIDELKDENDVNSQDVIVIDGRGYEDDSPINEEVYNLVDVIDEHQLSNKRYEDIMQRVEKMVENITRKMVPEIAERIIKEEIEKLKKSNAAE